MDQRSWDQQVPAATASAQFGDTIEPVTTTDTDDYDAVLVGEPYDRGTVTRRGARDGPVAIRAALSNVATHHLDVGPVDAIGDLGAVDIPFGGSVPTAREAVRETLDTLHDSDAVPVVLGGDSSLTVANVAGLLTAETAANGGERTDGPRVSSELRSDGGFGDDEESVGDVEHFDPAGGGSDEDDQDSVDEDTETADTAESEDAEPTEEGGDTESDDTPAQVDEGSETEETDADEEVHDEVDEEPESTDDEASAPSEEDPEAVNGDGESESAEQTANADQGEDAEQAGSKEVVEDSGVGETGFGTDDESATEVVEETPGRSTVTTEAASTGAVGVVRLSARLDCQPVDSEPTNRSVGRQLLEAGVDSLAVVGARHFESTTAEAEYLRDNGGAVVTAEEVGEDPVEAANRALDTAEDVEHLYLSIDLSVLDATAAPGVSAPAPGGLQSRELFRVVRLLAGDDRLAGLEVVETAPTHDREGQTVDAAARTVAHALAALQA